MLKSLILICLDQRAESTSRNNSESRCGSEFGSGSIIILIIILWRPRMDQCKGGKSPDVSGAKSAEACLSKPVPVLYSQSYLYTGINQHPLL